ncbi:MAG: phospho-sugar mutase [Chitinivibrionales bacterium]
MDTLSAANKYMEFEEAPEFIQEIKELIQNDKRDELNDRFYTDLSFGTGGMRGVIGGGFNRINPYTIKRATQGLADYVRSIKPRSPSGVICFDSRNYSKEFAEYTAEVLCGNGITTYLFESLRPVPELSFAIRHLNANFGIAITASHNPPEYNGYKVYWGSGGQIVSPHDRRISEFISRSFEIKSLNLETAAEKDLCIRIGEKIDKEYKKAVNKLSINREVFKDTKKSGPVVYTPIHGTGGEIIPGLLNENGIEVVIPEEQKEPDGNFPSVKSPNPEEASALQMGIDKAEEINADLVIGTDPDCDRIGTAILHNNEYVLVNGNQLGVLLVEYLFSSLKNRNRLPEKPVFINTIVTTELQKKIAESYNAKTHSVLTGFKYIAEKIQRLENEGNLSRFIMGCEESYGYLVGTDVRDKDAVIASLLTCEMYLFCRKEGKTLIDKLEEIYSKYGYFTEALLTKEFKGQKGKDLMQDLVASFRKEPPEAIAGEGIALIKDYLDGTVYSSTRNTKDISIDLPSSNVMQFITDKDSIISLRPSGTEPKIKIYISCRNTTGYNQDIKRETDERIKGIANFITGIVNDYAGQQ